MNDNAKQISIGKILVAAVLAFPLASNTMPWIRSDFCANIAFASEESYQQFVTHAFNIVFILAFFSALAVINAISRLIKRYNIFRGEAGIKQ